MRAWEVSFWILEGHLLEGLKVILGRMFPDETNGY
jgi:hypothetical protein